MSINSYEKAGVSIEKGDNFADFIAKKKSSAISSALGGFAGVTAIDMSQYKEPLMLSATDGVGTKLLVAKELKQYNTIGIDLVAMCVNDLIVCGAAPSIFLDYIACGGIDEEILHPVMEGIIKGCEQAECTLSGGETAEMPEMYAKDDIDLAGFSVGLVDKSKLLPKPEQMKEGNVIFGLPSVGIHSNGLSLARKVLDKSEWNKLITPTKIYVKDLKPFLEKELLLGAAHITGGGLEGNLKRALPENLSPHFTYDWPVPEVFTEIEEKGEISRDEMRKVFNMGIGMALIVEMEKLEIFLETAADNNIDVLPIGELRLG